MHASEFEALRRDLAALVGDRHVSVRPAERALYGRDTWARALLWDRAREVRYQPDVVAWPGSLDEVRRVVLYARGRHVPVTAFGGGSAHSGAAIPARAGITLDLKRLRRVLDVDLPGRRVKAQAGILGQRLEAALAAQGATLGHVPDDLYTATLGGWIATRSAGQLSAHYGTLADMVLGLTAVTGAGEVVQTGPERQPGPDLVQLLAGSEGALAIVTDATLALHPRPVRRAMRAFGLRSVPAGLEAVRALLRAGLRPHVLRLSDPVETQFGREGAASGGPVKTMFGALRSHTLGVALRAPAVLNRAAELLPPRCELLLSFEGEHEATLEEDLQEATDLLREAGATDLGEGPARRWYRRRFAQGYRVPLVFLGHAWIDHFDVATTWDRAPGVYEAVRRAVWPEAFVHARFSHAFLEGTAITFTFQGPALDPGRGEASLERTLRAAARAALEQGATVSHHSGVGLARARFLPDELGDSGMRVLRGLKRAFDPDGILNPGKLTA